ncbi:MAG TPA: hypothetical protein VK603_13545 [Candidatus Saccharimonadales bacterium]|nr:hypothetical protein [Candidatus Saccharimonadales bacterium]
MRDKSISDDYIDLSGLTAEEREEFSRIAIQRSFVALGSSTRETY